jgi:glycyl-tRNA synthetase
MSSPSGANAQVETPYDAFHASGRIRRPGTERSHQVPDLMEDIVSLAKRRGFAFQSSEIYGGLRSSWDYGPLGVEMKNNIKQAWWRTMVQLRDDVVGLDAAVIMSPKVWEASGHLEVFADPLVECLSCHQRFRLDHLPEPPVCPNCGSKGFTDPRNFNLMFKTYMGPVPDEENAVYLRPETAQAMFVDFPQVQTTSRKKIPFGIAQIGKSFRNEITPGNFVFRMREFEQMEMEFFVEPGTDVEWHDYWIEARHRWYLDLGLKPDHLRLREHEGDELSHYSKRTVDLEYAYPWTDWAELEGVANRGDYDLKAHEAASGQDLTYFDQEKETRYHPYVIEPAVSVDRALLAFLIDAYTVDEAPTAKGTTEKRTVLKLHPAIAPVKVAVLPLSRNERLAPEAKELHERIRRHFVSQFDDAGAIGRRYRRQDEIGTPFCVTVDFDTLDDRAVTVRERDSMAQDRVPVADVVEYLRERL